MSKTKYKYNINHLLTLLPRAKTMKIVVAELEDEGISERGFFRDRAILIGSESDIPSQRLMVYAKYFNVPIEQLFNYETKVKPAIERKPSELMKKVIKRTGLKR